MVIYTAISKKVVIVNSRYWNRKQALRQGDARGADVPPPLRTKNVRLTGSKKI